MPASHCPHAARHYRLLILLALLHVIIIAASNYLVQLPFVLFGFHTTAGAFTYPLIFVITDLTVRLSGAPLARRIVFWAMGPALIASWLVSMLFVDGHFSGWNNLFIVNTVVYRVVLASLSAYVCGQILDIVVFRRLRQLKTWWVAPACANTLGSFMDTLVFFSVAFYASSDAFMATHWVEIAWFDYAFKLFVGVLLFVPLYGVLLAWLKKRLMRLLQYSQTQAAKPLSS